MKSPSNASGRDVAKALHGSMTASATSSCTRIIAHSYAMAAESHLHDLMPSTVIVRYTLQYAFCAPVLIISYCFSAV
jgi:hypothetical protein